MVCWLSDVTGTCFVGLAYFLNIIPGAWRKIIGHVIFLVIRAGGGGGWSGSALRFVHNMRLLVVSCLTMDCRVGSRTGPAGLLVKYCVVKVLESSCYNEDELLVTGCKLSVLSKLSVWEGQTSAHNIRT